MSKVELVGILNLTPDSFSDDGIYLNPDVAVDAVDTLVREGASFIDVGAESTRPGATPVGEDEEWKRLKPVLEPLLAAYPGRISLDSRHPQVVRRVVESIGAIIVNDVTGFNNPEMVQVVADYGLKCVISHFPVNFHQNVQAAHAAENKIDDVAQVRNDLLRKRDELIGAGIEKGDIVLDPGIGFEKTRQLNLQLLSFGALVPDVDVMIGYSRKRFLGPSRMLLDANLRAGDVAVQNDATYLRVHDVKGHARHFCSKGRK